MTTNALECLARYVRRHPVTVQFSEPSACDVIRGAAERGESLSYTAHVCTVAFGARMRFLFFIRTPIERSYCRLETPSGSRECVSWALQSLPDLFDKQLLWSNQGARHYLIIVTTLQWMWTRVLEETVEHGHDFVNFNLVYKNCFTL